MNIVVPKTEIINYLLTMRIINPDNPFNLVQIIIATRIDVDLLIKYTSFVYDLIEEARLQIRTTEY